MKRSYSYFIIKPDGIRYIDDICKEIENEFESIIYYNLDDFADITRKLNYKNYEQKGENFKKIYDEYLYGVNQIFGNKGLLILLGDTRISQQELVEKVYEKKIELRKKYINENVGIATNYEPEKAKKKNYIRIIEEDGTQKNPRIMKELGNHRISDLNTIHSPDPNIEDTIAELKIIDEQNIITEENRIIPEIMNKIKKYKTLNITEDMKEETYEGEIGPNISGFYKSEIEQMEK